MIRTICSRTSSDYKRLTKHENEDAQWIIARSENVCDKPGKTSSTKSIFASLHNNQPRNDQEE